MKHIDGLIAAPFTGFHADGSLHMEMVAKQAAFYKNNKLSGVFICGSTGESPSMSVQEKKALFKEWGKFRADDFPVIAFLGGTSIRECIELAQYAQECGLDAVSVTAPYYFRPSGVSVLAQWCDQIASSVPDLDFYYYHIPSLTGVYLPMTELLAQMDDSIPNLAGIKYTHENMMEYQLCLNYKNRKYNIMWGRDEMLLQALSIGARAAVGSTYGYTAPVYHSIVDAFRAGDMTLAAELQLQAVRLITLLGKYGSGCGKAFMKAVGLDLGPCRMPQQTLSEEQFAQFDNDLKTMEFEKYSCL